MCPIAVTALFFGGFQALMPLLGWCLGVHFEKYITSIDHWIAFCLLAFLGVKMISDIGSESEETSEDASSDTESGSGETESSLETETSADETN